MGVPVAMLNSVELAVPGPVAMPGPALEIPYAAFWVSAAQAKVPLASP